MPSRAIHWVKEHAGLWTLAILIIGVLGLQGGIGRWALNLHDEKLTAQVQSEVKRLDGRIDGTTELLNRVSQQITNMDKKIDKLGETLGTRVETLGTRVDRIYDILLKRLPPPNPQNPG